MCKGMSRIDAQQLYRQCKPVFGNTSLAIAAAQYGDLKLAKTFDRIGGLGEEQIIQQTFDAVKSFWQRTDGVV